MKGYGIAMHVYKADCTVHVKYDIYNTLASL